MCFLPAYLTMHAIRRQMVRSPRQYLCSDVVSRYLGCVMFCLSICLFVRPLSEPKRTLLFIYLYICGCPKQSGGSYVIRPTRYETTNPHGPMGPKGPKGPMDPMGPVGPMGAHGDPWVPWGPWRPWGPMGPMGPMGPWAPWPHRAQAGRPRRRTADGRRPAGSATQFGDLRNRHLFLNKIKQLCFGRPHIYIWYIYIHIYVYIYIYICIHICMYKCMGPHGRQRPGPPKPRDHKPLRM